MPETTPTSKVFTYQGDGLSYTITVTQGTDGTFTARLEVTEGQADINAVYWGDDDMSGRSTSLPGALNMNGGGSQFEGEPVQWDGALKLSDPGLGRAGVDKTTFLQEGEALEFDLPISSFDDIAFIGIRATSTSTPEGSIKGVTPGTDIVDDDDNDDDDDCDDDCDVCDTPVRDDYPTLPDGTTGVTFSVDILGEVKSTSSSMSRAKRQPSLTTLRPRLPIMLRCWTRGLRRMVSLARPSLSRR